MAALIEQYRAPHRARLEETLAVSEGLLYRRGNFNGTLDQVILDALLDGAGAEIAFSPGFRWGTTILPGAPITFEDVMNATAITYPSVTVNELTGEAIKSLLEDICDNLFNPDPYYQQGGDMVRIGGMRYACAPNEKIGNRISGMTLNGKPIEADKRYKVASWAPVAEGVSGEPVWALVANYLRARKRVGPPRLNRPALLGAQGDGGVAETLR
jgi:sulfur-oxidizing protein SoxB